MLNSKTGLKTAICLTASLLASLLSGSSSAAIIYDNSEILLFDRTDQGSVEHGDVINFAGTDRILTTIEFEYFVTPGGSGNEMAQLFLYALDGPIAAQGTSLPGSLLYSSVPFSLTGGTAAGYGTAEIRDLAVVIPDSVAWTVSFTGLEGAEAAGLLFYSSGQEQVGSNPMFLDPDLGSQQHYTIRRDGATWELLNHDGVTDNLGARFTAVPEPTTWALMLGGLATIGLLRRRK